METAIWVAIITAVPATLAAMGKAASYVIDKIQSRGKTAIDAKNTELQEKDKLLAKKDERIEAQDGLLAKKDERILFLERRLALFEEKERENDTP